MRCCWRIEVRTTHCDSVPRKTRSSNACYSRVAVPVDPGKALLRMGQSRHSEVGGWRGDVDLLLAEPYRRCGGWRARWAAKRKEMCACADARDAGSQE